MLAAASSCYPASVTQLCSGPLQASSGDYNCGSTKLLPPGAKSIHRMTDHHDSESVGSAGVVVQNAVMAPADELRRQIRTWAVRNGVDLRAVAQVTMPAQCKPRSLTCTTTPQFELFSLHSPLALVGSQR